MPELPEVETTRLGLVPRVVGYPLERVEIRNDRLRWPVDSVALRSCLGQSITAIDRRAKYLLFFWSNQKVMLVHLGMSGSLRLSLPEAPVRPHDHVFWSLNALDVRYHDPRRFGSILFTGDDWQNHPLLLHLGVEPLSSDWNEAYLWQHSRNKQVSIKALLMNQRIVVGVGNIYAQEALFAAGIYPAKPAGQLSHGDVECLVPAVTDQLQHALRVGGSSLRDYVHGHGETGYFQLQLKVYGRKGKLCPDCGAALQTVRIVGRSTTWCPVCQT